MEKFKVMMGVSPGYFSTENPTAKEAKEKAEKFVEERLRKELGLNATITPASAVYHRQWGCPEGGEVGVVVEGTIDHTRREKLEKQMSLLMADLGQSTSTIEYDADGRLSSAYIQNSYQENVERSAETLFNTDISRSTDDLSFALTIEGTYMDVGTTLQNRFERTSSDDYTITGYIKDLENGKVIYEGTRRPEYGQTDPQKYMDSVAKIANDMEIRCTDMQFAGKTEGTRIPELAEKPELYKPIQFVKGIKKIFEENPELDRIPELDAAIEKVENSEFGSKEQILALKEFAEIHSTQVLAEPMVDFTEILIDVTDLQIANGNEEFNDIKNELVSLNKNIEKMQELESDLNLDENSLSFDEEILTQGGDD